MKKLKKTIISLILSLFILAGNFPFAYAVPFPQDIEPSSSGATPSSKSTSDLSTTDSGSTSSSIVNPNLFSNYPPQCNPTTIVQNETTFLKPGYFNSNPQVINGQMYYQPNEIYIQYPGYIQPQNQSEVYAQCPSYVQQQNPNEVYAQYPSYIQHQNPSEVYTQYPSYIQQQNSSGVYTQYPGYTQQTIDYTTQTQERFVITNQPLYSECLPQPEIVQKPISTYKLQLLPILPKAMYVNQNLKSPAECFKPIKNQEVLPRISSLSTKKKCFDPNNSLKKIISTEANKKYDITLDPAFTHISNYIFDSSFTALKSYITEEMLNNQKYFFTKTKNQVYLEYVKYACFEHIKHYKCPQIDKQRLKKFLDLSTALESTKENICILILIYSQILRLEYRHDLTLSNNIKIVSKDVSKKIKKINSLKLKNPQEYPDCAQHISRIYKNQKFYLDIYNAIIENILKCIESPQLILKEIKIDPYLN